MQCNISKPDVFFIKSWNYGEAWPIILQQQFYRISRPDLPAQADEMIQTPFKPAAEPGSPAVAIRDGSFAWQEGGDSLLRDINLQVPASQLIIVIGEVDAALFLKSSQTSQRSLALLEGH